MAPTFFWCLMATLLVGTLGFPYLFAAPYAMSYMYRRPFYGRFYGRYRSPMYRRSFRYRRFPRYRRFRYLDSDYYEDYRENRYEDYYENLFDGDFFENRYGERDRDGGYYGRF